MKKRKYLPYFISILIPLAIGGIAAIFTVKGMPFYESQRKPWFTPPKFLFPIVWTILYLLMGIGAALIWQSDSPSKRTALKRYAVQLAANFLWSVIFFWTALVFDRLFMASFPYLPNHWDDTVVSLHPPRCRIPANPLSAMVLLRCYSQFFHLVPEPLIPPPSKGGFYLYYFSIGTHAAIAQTSNQGFSVSFFIHFQKFSRHFPSKCYNRPMEA